MAQFSLLLHLFFLLHTIFLYHSPAHVTASTSEAGVPPPRVHHGKSIMTPTLAIILACLISTFLLAFFVSIYVHRCIDRHMTLSLFQGPTSNQGNWPWQEVAMTHGLDPRVVASFPTFFYLEVKELKIGQCAIECAVCLNEFEDEESLQLVPKCWHVFHPDCIQSWLSSHVTCPVCRADLVSGLSQAGHQVPTLRSAPADIPTMNENEIVEHFQSPDEITVVNSPITFPSQKSASRKQQRYRVNLRKSFSTGHSLVLPVENCERFTLRLPDEVQNRLMNSSLEGGQSSNVTFPGEKSRRKGFRSTSSGGGYDRFNSEAEAHRWVFTATPFFARMGLSRPMVTGSGGSDGATEARPLGLFKSVTSPISRLFGGPSSPKDYINVEDQSTDVLVLDGKV